MQIHEITSRKRLHEADIFGAIGSALTNKFVQSTLGVSADQMNRGGGAGSQDARARATTKMTQQAAALLGPQLNKAWNLSVQDFMKNHKDTAGNPLTSMRMANPADANRLRQELGRMIKNSTQITQPLDQWVANIDTGDVSDKEEARLIAEKIKNLEAAIWSETVEPRDPRGQALTQAFAELGTAIAQAQNVNTFTAKDPTERPGAERVTFDDATGKFKIDGRDYNEADPAHRALVADWMRRSRS